LSSGFNGRSSDCTEAKKAERKQRAVSEIMLEVKSLQDKEILVLKENTEFFFGECVRYMAECEAESCQLKAGTTRITLKQRDGHLSLEVSKTSKLKAQALQSVF
jgi:hypothetical protein